MSIEPVLDNQSYQYAAALSADQCPYASQLYAYTMSQLGGAMMTAKEQVALLRWLMVAIGAKKALEIGTFTGYATLAFAKAVGSDGCVATIDVSDAHFAVAKETWKNAGVVQRITAYHAVADQLLSSWNNEKNDWFDFCYIDADKKKNQLYYEYALKYTRKMGVIVIDNVLFKGRVANENCNHSMLESIRAFNRFVAQDQRVDAVTLAIADGMTIVLKK